MGVNCMTCSKAFSTSCVLNRHISEMHQKLDGDSVEPEFGPQESKCLDGCELVFKSSSELREHLQTVHGFDVKQEELDFENFEAFKEWLEKLEGRYECAEKSKRNSDCEISYYNCAGNEKPPSTRGYVRKRKLDAETAVCTSGVTVFKRLDSGKCFVVYYSAHYKHAPCITKDGGDSKLSRKEERCLQQVEDFVTKNKDECVLFYKKLGEEHPHLNSDDVCLILVNQEQEDALRKYSETLVCVDSTFNISHTFNLDLVVISVVNDSGRGITTVVMFTNTRDNVLEFLLDQVKSKVGTLHSQVLITDLNEEMAELWSKIMGGSPKMLYAPWETNRCWKKNLAKIEDDEKRNDVNKVLSLLQDVKEKSLFTKQLNSMVTVLENDEATREFAEYFVKNYYDTYESWAQVYQKESIPISVEFNTLHKPVKVFLTSVKQCKKFGDIMGVLAPFLKGEPPARRTKTVKNVKTPKSIISDIKTRCRGLADLDLMNIDVGVLERVKKSIDDAYNLCLSQAKENSAFEIVEVKNVDGDKDQSDRKGEGDAEIITIIVNE